MKIVVETLANNDDKSLKVGDTKDNLPFPDNSTTGADSTSSVSDCEKEIIEEIREDNNAVPESSQEIIIDDKNGIDNKGKYLSGPKSQTPNEKRIKKLRVTIARKGIGLERNNVTIIKQKKKINTLECKKEIFIYQLKSSKERLKDVETNAKERTKGMEKVLKEERARLSKNIENQVTILSDLINLQKLMIENQKIVMSDNNKSLRVEKEGNQKMKQGYEKKFQKMYKDIDLMETSKNDMERMFHYDKEAKQANMVTIKKLEIRISKLVATGVEVEALTKKEEVLSLTIEKEEIRTNQIKERQKWDKINNKFKTR